MDHSERHLSCVRLLIANHTIHPRIRDFDRHFISPGLQRSRDVDTVRRVPYNANSFAVHRNFREVLHSAQINPDLLSWVEPTRRRIDGLRVSAKTAEVANPGIGVFAP